MRINWLVVLGTLTIFGCVTVQFTPEGRNVRTITPIVAQTCDYFGLARSWKPSLEGGLTAGQIDIRNKVAARGGNAMVVVAQQVDPPPYQHAEIMAEAYRCDFPKPTQ